MAAPIVPLFIQQVIKSTGRTVFRKAGRFISESTYKRGTSALRRAGKSNISRALTTTERRSTTSLAQQIMNQVGPPIGGGNWISRVRQSSERFIDMVGNDNDLG